MIKFNKILSLVVSSVALLTSCKSSADISTSQSSSTSTSLTTSTTSQTTSTTSSSPSSSSSSQTSSSTPQPETDPNVPKTEITQQQALESLNNITLDLSKENLQIFGNTQPRAVNLGFDSDLTTFSENDYSYVLKRNANDTLIINRPYSYIEAKIYYRTSDYAENYYSTYEDGTHISEDVYTFKYSQSKSTIGDRSRDEQNAFDILNGIYFDYKFDIVKGLSLNVEDNQNATFYYEYTNGLAYYTYSYYVDDLDYFLNLHKTTTFTTDKDFNLLFIETESRVANIDMYKYEDGVFDSDLLMKDTFKVSYERPEIEKPTNIGNVYENLPSRVNLKYDTKTNYLFFKNTNTDTGEEQYVQYFTFDNTKESVEIPTLYYFDGATYTPVENVEYYYDSELTLKIENNMITKDGYGASIQAIYPKFNNYNLTIDANGGYLEGSTQLKSHVSKGLNIYKHMYYFDTDKIYDQLSYVKPGYSNYRLYDIDRGKYVDKITYTPQDTEINLRVDYSNYDVKSITVKANDGHVYGTFIGTYYNQSTAVTSSSFGAFYYLAYNGAAVKLIVDSETLNQAVYTVEYYDPADCIKVYFDYSPFYGDVATFVTNPMTPNFIYIPKTTGYENSTALAQEYYKNFYYVLGLLNDVGSFLPKANYTYQSFDGSWYYNGNVEFSSSNIDRITSSITLTPMFF